MIRKKIILVLILASVFIIGTINLVDTVEATKWTKDDSGKIQIQNDTFTYKTYIKESKQIRIDISYKKILLTKTYLTKTKTGINAITLNNQGKTITKKFTKTKMDIKTFYTHFKKGYNLIK